MHHPYETLLKQYIGHPTFGFLTIETPTGYVMEFKGDQEGPTAHFHIHNWKTIDLLLSRGDIGFGEAYHDGYWSTPNLPDLLTFFSKNLDAVSSNASPTRFRTFLYYLYNNWIRLNTKWGSRKNILSHYDIGNDFYKLWLDPTMTYSSALRTSPDDTLKLAQENKYQRIQDVLNIGDKSVLEIGCGWGGFAERAIQEGARLTGVTISKAQHQFATNRVQGKADILLTDYRDIKSTFDRVVSIEMFEAVGEKYWPQYFSKIKSSLNKGGKALIQTITFQEEGYEEYKKGSDYIRHHIFPGGFLPSQSAFQKAAKKQGLETVSVHHFGEDYAWTLREWLKNFNEVKNQLSHFPESFLRLWEFYLAYCIAGFESGRTSVMQVELAP